MDEITESEIEKSKVKNSHGKRERRQWEDGLVVDEVSKEKNCLNIYI